MPTTLTLPYTRFVRQVTSGPGSLPQFVALMDENFIKLQAAAWVPSSALPNDVAMPANTPLTFTLNDKYDAFKMSSTTSASGIETAYAGMAAYRLKIPADAITGSKHIKGLTVTLGADKFAYSGIKVAIHATDDTTPATSWEILRAGAIGSTVDTSKKFATYDADPEVSGVLDAPEASVSSATNKAQSFVFDLSAINANYSYLWIYISMYNYTDYRASRPYWVEGAGIVNGATAVVEFESSVTADTDIAWNGLVVAQSSVELSPTSGAVDNCAVVVAKHSKSTHVQLAAGFPVFSAATATINAFVGSSGTSIGFDTSGSDSRVTGAYAIRFYPADNSRSFSKLSFSGSTLLDLSAKKFKCRLCIWSGIVANPSLAIYYLNKHPENTGNTVVPGEGLLQVDAFAGAATLSVTNVDYMGVNSTVWSMVKAGEFSLNGASYTSSTEFDVSIPSGIGAGIIIATIVPTDYWGSVGADTVATFTPGTYIYLK